MKRYTIDLEAWTTIEAKNSREAMSLAQGIINKLADYAQEELGLELEAVVADDGIQREEE